MANSVQPERADSSGIPGIQRHDPRRAMGLSTSNPFVAMRNLVEELEQRMFEGIGSSMMRNPFESLFHQSLWSPDVEMFSRGNELIIRVDLPGLQPDDLNVQIENGELTISGERRSEQTEERAGVWHSERKYSTFIRKLALPADVREDDVKANFRNGVLEISFPAPKRQGRSIPISAEGHPSKMEHSSGTDPGTGGGGSDTTTH